MLGGPRVDVFPLKIRSVYHKIINNEISVSFFLENPNDT
jgi:hypothetical protein